MTEDAKIITAKLFASKYEKPMIDVLVNSCPQIAEMSSEDIKSILCVCLGLGPNLSDKEFLSHDFVEEIVECTIILSFLWDYKIPELFSPEGKNEWIIDSIKRAKKGVYGEIPGTQIMVEVFENEIEISSNSIKRPSRKITKNITKKWTVTNSKTYLMFDSNTKCTKIGRSKNPRIRERTLQSEKPTITLFRVCEKDVEQRLHTKFSHKNIRGEWFDLTQEDIDWICKEYDFKEVE